MKRFRNMFKEWLFKQKTLYFYFLVVMMVPTLLLLGTESMSAIVVTAFILLPLSLYAVVLSVVRKPGIVFGILLPIHILGAFQLVLLYLFGGSIIATDMFLNVCTTNSMEILELLDKLLPPIIGVILLYVPALVLAVYSIRSSEKLSPCFQVRTILSGIGLFLVGLAFTAWAYHKEPDFRVYRDIYPVNVLRNMKYAYIRWAASENYHETSKDFRFHAKSTHDADCREIYVMVVGETSRPLNWGLYGYERNTTPRLSTMSNLVFFSDVLTQSNATHKSVPLILSAASAEQADIIYSQKSVITAFKEAGFKTVFFSNQRPNGSLIDFFAEEADISLFLKQNVTDEKFNPYDEELVKLLDRLLQEGDQKLFIVLHTYGSHFNYRERYPAGMAPYQPDNIDEVSFKMRQNLVNAFDNTIYYTDYILGLIVDKLSATGADAAMVYISDHGEDLFDDNRKLFLHSSPVPDYYQIHVPFVIWMSDSYIVRYPQILSVAEQHRECAMSSQVVFHTLLSLGGVETPYRDEKLSVVDTLFTVLPRYYLNDHNRPLSLDKAGLKPEDIEMFKRLHLVYP